MASPFAFGGIFPANTDFFIGNLMSKDIRLAVSFRGHRKRKKLEAMVGAEGVMCLVDLWIGVAMSRPLGVLNGWDAYDIAAESGWRNDPAVFVDALVRCGFIDDDNGTYKLHDWEEHQGYVVHAPARSNQAKVAASARWAKKNGQSFQEPDADSMPGAMLIDANSNAPIPYPLPNPIPLPNPTPKKTAAKSVSIDGIHEFDQQAMVEFITHRKAIKKPLSQKALELNYKRIKECATAKGVKVADIVDHIILKGWQSVEIGWLDNAPIGATTKRCQSCRMDGYCHPSSANRKNPHGCREYEEKK